jgi:hypothetical protein
MNHLIQPVIGFFVALLFITIVDGIVRVISNKLEDDHIYRGFWIFNVLD